MKSADWQVNWAAARVRAPEHGTSWLSDPQRALHCERVGLSAGLAVCQVQGRSEQAMEFEAPGVSQRRAHLQFVAHGRCELLDAEADHRIAPTIPTVFSPPSGSVAWRVGPEERLHVISIDVTESALAHWCDDRDTHTLLFARRRTPPTLDQGGGRSMYAQLCSLLANGTPRGPTWRLACESLVLQVMADTLGRLGAAPAGAGLGAADTRRLRAARELLLDAPAPPVTLLSLAQAVGMPLRRLQRLYQDTYGLPLKHALQQARLDAAHRALLRGDLSIKQIAWQAGFLHPTSFTHAFRARFGIPPSALTSRRVPA
jgi:AraC-like DNA-binding protein